MLNIGSCRQGIGLYVTFPDTLLSNPLLLLFLVHKKLFYTTQTTSLCLSFEVFEVFFLATRLSLFFKLYTYVDNNNNTKINIY